MTVLPQYRAGSHSHPIRIPLAVNDYTSPVNVLDPIRIRSVSAGKHWPEAGRMILAHWLASGPDPFGQNLTQSARTKSDPGWFCTILSGASAEERNRVWKWETDSGPVVSCQIPGPMIPAHRLASKPDAFGQNPDQTIQIGSGPVVYSMTHAFFWKTELKRMREVGSGIYTIRPDSGCTLSVMAISGRNQDASGPDLACLLCHDSEEVNPKIV